MYVVTFYSYKGGVGRTMALVNVAALLAAQGKRVLIVDFDLEAPGVPSYGLLNCAHGQKGIVDYVHHYLETSEAPNAADYIIECAVDGEHKIWVMPAGDNTQASYSPRFASIDWDYLYKHQHGADLLDDLKNQWADHEAEFDYVFIDSRTGNTDIGGICTRQLPDAVVNMFVPTKQNIDGLVPIVNQIREDAIAQERPISLLFCPSNIPDLFDEDDILGKALKNAAQKLGYGNPAELEPPVSYVRHWPNMELLDQPLVVLSRAQSKLAKEYQKLTTAIISQNAADRDGALAALERLPGIYEATRKGRKSQTATKVIDLALEISKHHETDSDVAIAAARLFSAAGEYEQEERSLSNAIRASDGIGRPRLLRAVARINLNRKEAALEDLREIITSPDGTNFEFRPAIQLFPTVVDEPLKEGFELFSRPRTHIRAKIELSRLLLSDRSYHSAIADELQAAMKREEPSDDLRLNLVNTIMLALIGSGRFEEAIAFARSYRDDESDSESFNLAIASWGATGVVPQEQFALLDEKLTMDDADQNVHQCIALVRGIVGRTDDALAELTKSQDRSTTGGAFSCWTFTQRSAEQFSADLDAMREALENGLELNPPFLAYRN